MSWRVLLWSRRGIGKNDEERSESKSITPPSYATNNLTTFHSSLCSLPPTIPTLFAIRFAHRRALQARVENYREMKLNGIIVNYVERSSRRGKSIIEKLGKEPEVLKLYMKGYNGAPATVSPHSNKSVKHLKHRQSMMPAQKYGNVPSNLVSIIQRVTPGREIYPKLEDVVVKGFRLGGNDEEVESDLVPWSDTVGVIRVDCFYVTELAEENTPESASCCDEVSPKAKLTFTFPSNCGKEFSAFCRIWLHSLCHFHGIGGKSLKGKGGKGGKFVIKGKVGEVDDGRLTEEVNRRWEE